MASFCSLSPFLTVSRPRDLVGSFRGRHRSCGESPLNGRFTLSFGTKPGPNLLRLEILTMSSMILAAANSTTTEINDLDNLKGQYIGANPGKPCLGDNTRSEHRPTTINRLANPI